MSMMAGGDQEVDVGARSKGHNFCLAFEGDGLVGSCASVTTKLA